TYYFSVLRLLSVSTFSFFYSYCHHPLLHSFPTRRSSDLSPYLFYLQLNDVAVVGSSPEMLVKVQGRDVFYRPIAGTRWRGKDEAEDQRLEQEMLASEKERAEHIMLVDLGRNDLGRVCDYGTVKPEKLLTVERYSHVM